MSPRKARSTSGAKADTKASAKAGAKASGKSQPSAAADRAIGTAASQRIDERIESLQDWRGAALAQVRRIIHAADPEIVEEWKWMGTPVWSHAGNVCTGETYKQVVKLTFARGASLPDPRGLFNSSLEGNVRRAIDIHEGDEIDAAALQALIQAAVAENVSASASKSQRKTKANAKSDAPSEAKSMSKPKPKPDPKPKAESESTSIASSKSTARSKSKSKSTAKSGEQPPPNSAGTGAKVVLLSGGNPQIAKADGDAPVQAYIAAMPGWKSDLGKRLDALIVRTVPQVQKAVRWNSPFYRVEGKGWFLSFHVLTRYVKVTFFDGLSLEPIPPGGTPKSQQSRWIDIYEDDVLDESQFASWVRQAAVLPGWVP